MALHITIADLRQRMADALPTHPKDDDSSDLASSYELIALLVHAYMTSLGFKLQGFNEDKRLRMCPCRLLSPPNGSLTLMTAECESLHPRLPPQWNNGYGALSFVYTHKQSSMTFVIRVDRMGAKVEVRGLAVGDENIHRVERSIRDIVDAGGLPIRITINDGEEDRSDLAEKIGKALKSEDAVTGMRSSQLGDALANDLTDLLRDVQTKIIQKLIPKLQKEGYTELQTPDDADAASSAQDAARRRAEAQRLMEEEDRARRNDPSRLPFHPDIPRGAGPRPVPDFPPPDFENELEINRPPRPLGPGQSPFNIGHDDLNPPGLGPNDPLRGSFIGGGLPRPGGGSGMHPTFDDPLFTGQGRFGPEGQGGYDPQAPPGARWDPLGPGEFPRFPGPGSGRGNNPFGGGGGGYGGFGGGGII